LNATIVDFSVDLDLGISGRFFPREERESILMLTKVMDEGVKGVVRREEYDQTRGHS
jgi:hypothetical protein